MIVVPVSGGKDSQACLKLAIQTGKKVIGLFCDTQHEHPLTYAHIEFMRHWYGVEIERLCAGSVEDLVIRYGKFPFPLGRFCTEALKIRPSSHWYQQKAIELGHGFEVWYGVRKEESVSRAKRYAGKVGDEVYLPHDFMKNYPKRLGKMGVVFRLPIIDWSEQDVFDFVGEEVNPLYAKGCARVGCFPCYASGDANKRQNFTLDDFGRRQYEKALDLEAIFCSNTLFTKTEDGNGCSICSI